MPGAPGRSVGARHLPDLPAFPRASSDSGPQGPLALGGVLDLIKPAQDRFLIPHPELKDRTPARVLARAPKLLFGFAVEGQALLADTALGIDETREAVGGKVFSEPERYQEWEADLLGAGLLLNPLREGLAALRRKTERAAVPRPELTGDDQPLFLKHLQLPIGVALRHIPEAPEPARDFLEELPACPGPLVQEAEQRGLGAVELRHVDIPFWKVRLLHVPQGNMSAVRRGAQSMSKEPQLGSVLQALEREGYAVVEDLLDKKGLEAARAEVGATLQKTPFGRDQFEGRRTKRAYALFAKVRALDAPATHPLVLAVLDRVLGHYQLNAPAAIEIGPGELAQPLHTDDAIYPLPRPHPEIVMSVMWPLVDFTEANGATCVVPQSHRLHARPDPERAISISLRAGSALFYLGSLWHGGGANLTARPRTGVVLNYAASWLRPIETHVLSVPPAQAAGLPERLQELLGYNIRPPFMGYVDGVHPKKLLQNRAHPHSAGLRAEDDA